MAEKFDMIAKVEEGANPILLGIAAPAEGEDVDIAAAFGTEVEQTLLISDHEWGKSPAANAAVRAVVRGTNGWDLIQSGKLDLSEGLFREAMDNGMEASTHIHDVASGEHEGIDPEAMRAIPVLKPPKRSFCPKCGSDIHANTMLQWRKVARLFRSSRVDATGGIDGNIPHSSRRSLPQRHAGHERRARRRNLAKAAKGDPTVIEVQTPRAVGKEHPKGTWKRKSASETGRQSSKAARRQVQVQAQTQGSQRSRAPEASQNQPPRLLHRRQHAGTTKKKVERHVRTEEGQEDLRRRGWRQRPIGS